MAEANPTSDADKSPPVNEPTGQEAIKETFESIIIAFILAFVFRAYVVEAFVIPTGSMAPTLLGEHLRITCQECGYTFAADPDERAMAQYLQMENKTVQRPYLTQAQLAKCPMCRYENPQPVGTRSSAGDRILVLKYVYSFSEPRRGDVVVFKNPQDPKINFIKRLVGLPGESLWVIEGNVYVKSAGAADSAWHIARKTDVEANRHAYDIQRSVWQPIYYSQYVPLNPSDAGRRADNRPWHAPWAIVAGQWQTEPDAPSRLLARPGKGYRHDSTDPAELQFDFREAMVLGNEFYEYPYDQYKSVPSDNEPIEDIRLTVDVEPDNAGLSVRLGTTARLDRDDPSAGSEPIWLDVDPQGRVTLGRRGDDGKPVELAAATVDPLPPGRSTRVELWFVDQEAIAWINGRRVLDWTFELSLPTLWDRPALNPNDFPKVSIEVAGAPVTLKHVDLDRDMYYSSVNPQYRTLGRGTLDKSRGRPRPGDPLNLEADQFFCMGDNSPQSSDGRFWPDVDPWITSRMFNGREVPGVVPRDLMMGRAFFVYFPAPLRIDRRHPGMFPNFGDMRFIH